MLVARDTTERTEGILNGTTKLVGTREATIMSGIVDLLENKQAYDLMASASNPYGDGKAAQRIVERLKYEYQVQ